ncbi:MAG: hypothetical protein ACYC3X_23230 [Pirellulaceae bacterium]
MSDHVLGLLKILAVSVTCCLTPSPAVSAAPNDTDSPGGESIKITVWLMPNEPWPGPRPQMGNRDEQIKKFNDDLRGSGVTVMNTTRPELVEKLPELNESYPTTLDGIQGQTGVIECFKQFVKKHDNKVEIDVRFILWEEALSLLKEELEQPMTLTRPEPDIAQIGSTWRAHFSPYAHEDSSVSLPLGGVHRQSFPTLPYILDVRILYYWKRSVARESDALIPEEQGATVRDFEDWKEVIERLRELNASVRYGGSNPGNETPMPGVFPIEIGSPDQLHNYAPLVWSGGGKFVDAVGRVDLSSDKALDVPRLLRGSVWQSTPGEQPYRLIKFVNDNQYAIQDAFIKGEYGAAIFPINLLPRFYGMSKEHWDTDPWNHVGLGMLPRTFRGGSDLLVTRRASSHIGKKELVFELACELAPDDSAESEYARVLAKHGLMPARLDDAGLELLFEELGVSRKDGAEPPEMVKKLVTYVAEADRCVQYPDLPDWPTRFETPQVNDLFHELWLRLDSMSAEDAKSDVGLVDVAEAAEQQLNHPHVPPPPPPPPPPPWWSLLWSLLSSRSTLMIVGVLLGWAFLTSVVWLGLVWVYPKWAAILRWNHFAFWPLIPITIPYISGFLFPLPWLLGSFWLDLLPTIRLCLLDAWIEVHYRDRLEDPDVSWQLKLSRSFKPNQSRGDNIPVTKLTKSLEETIQIAAQKSVVQNHDIISILINGGTQDSARISEEDLASILRGKSVNLRKAPPPDLVSSLLDHHRMVVIIRDPGKAGDRLVSMTGLLDRHAEMLRVSLTN